MVQPPSPPAVADPAPLHRGSSLPTSTSAAGMFLLHTLWHQAPSSSSPADWGASPVTRMPPHPILILGLSILTSSHQSFKGPPQLPPPHFPVFTIFVALFMCDKSWNLKGHIRLSDHCLGPSLKLEALYCLHSACLPVSQHPGIQQLPGRQAARPGPQGT